MLLGLLFDYCIFGHDGGLEAGAALLVERAAHFAVVYRCLLGRLRL